MSPDGEVHIVDDDPGVRQSLGRLFNAAGLSARVYESGPAFLDISASVTTGCVLIDLRMPGMNGLELLMRLRARGFALPIVVMSGQGDIPTAVQAMKVGATDFIEKGLGNEILIQRIQQAIRGNNEAERNRGHEDAKSRIAALSPRERQVLEGIVAGGSSKVIAFNLGLSVRTVEVHRARMMERLGLRHMAEAVRLAVLAGIKSSPGTDPGKPAEDDSGQCIGQPCGVPLVAPASDGRTESMSTTLWKSRLVVPVSLERDHIRGCADAPITLLEYGDYECPHCAAARPIVSTILDQVGGAVRFVYRHFPLTIIHPHAEAAAEAAEAAGSQGRYWQLHDALYANQQDLTVPRLVTYAAALGLDLEQFTRETLGHVHLPKIADDFTSGVRSGVNGTPTFYVNDIRNDGGWDYETLLSALQQAAFKFGATPDF